jgi:hypothetical protein
MSDKDLFLTAFIVFHQQIERQVDLLDWNVMIEKQIEVLEKFGCNNINIIINNN